ncbi:ubiquitin-like protein-NEDD8-like protein RUB3 [Cornus florida]|uniref:ubiquitin-like protein-NEDD8-like protein RUB3 n=1 Tax=Cornus florida TaxID=4283 RepID=UPI002897D852|nr:ubiquitin-like protein-NEDD8-like protein RUB3 [Cornus florida]
MDLFFEPTRGRSFTIEVGYFDTVSEIKEKIQRYHGIPIPKQTLIFNNQVLHDELNVHSSEILDRSKIQLMVAVDPEKASVKVEESQPCNNKKTIQLLLKMPTSKLGVALEMDVNDTVRRLKERINETDGVPINRLVLHANGVELQDPRSLQESELSDHSEIEVGLRPSPTASSASGNSTGGSKKLKVMVLTKCGTKKIPVEVNAMDNVGELRKELQRLHHRFHFHLPMDGFFFIYKQNVMDEDRSFRWHHVGQGDTIEIFNGSVTGGS